MKQWGETSGLSPFLSGQKFEEERLKRLFGEQFEALTFILLYKFLKEHFIVIRASLYDDHKNKIDLLLIDKTVGAVICAVITVSDDADKLQIKAEDLWKINTEKNGVDLKYGLSLENGRLILKEFHNLPVFYFAFKKEKIKKHIDQLVCSLEQTSPTEDDLFKDLMWLLADQIKKLDEFHNLNPTLCAHLKMIKESLRKIADIL